MKVIKSVAFQTETKDDLFLLNHLNRVDNVSKTIKKALFESLNESEYKPKHKNNTNIDLRGIERLLELKLRRCWEGMKERCFYEKGKEYHNYGGRGITVSNEWMNYDVFAMDLKESFVEHIFEHGIKNTTLDRIDVNGNYEVSNCRWATIKEQANNTRKIKATH